VLAAILSLLQDVQPHVKHLEGGETIPPRHITLFVDVTEQVLVDVQIEPVLMLSADIEAEVL
jgi:hypothetical protein